MGHIEIIPSEHYFHVNFLPKHGPEGAETTVV